MAEYNVNIQLRAKTQQAEKALADIEGQVNSITKSTERANRSFAGLGKGVKAAQKVGASLKDIGVKGALARGALGGVALALGKAGAVATPVTNAVAGLTSGLGGLVLKATAATAGWGALGKAVAASGEAFNIAAKATAASEHILNGMAQALSGMPAAWGAAAVAAMAFGPQVLGAGKAINKAVGKEAERQIAATVNQFANLNQQVKFTASSFQELVKNSTLNQLNAQLADARHQLGEYRSDTQEAAKAAQQLVTVTKLQAAEQRAINDLVRKARGITQTELEERKAVKSLATAKERADFLKKEAKATKDLADAKRRLEQERTEEAKKNMAEKIDKRRKALEEETRRTKEAIKANYELGRAQDILADKRANAVLEMARQRRMAGRTMYGPGGAGPATAAFAANAEAAEITRLQNQAFRRDAEIITRKRVEFARMVDNVERGLALDLHRMKLEQEDRQYQERVNNAKRAAEAEQRAARTNAAQRRKRIPENLMLGAGFPMLFGGGAGAVAGGTAGAFMGDGFGAQIFFSAIGQRFDDLMRSAADLGQALDPLTADVNVIIEKVGITGTKTEKYIKALDAAGNETQALEAATRQLSIIVGDEGVDALKRFGEQSRELGNQFAEVMTRMGAEIAKLLEGTLNVVTKVVARQNALNAAKTSSDPTMQGLLKQFDERRSRQLFVGGVPVTGPGDAEAMAKLLDQMVERQNVLREQEEGRLRALQGISSEKTRTVESMEAELALAGTTGNILDEQVYSLRKNVIETEFRVELAKVLANKEHDIADVYLVQLKRKLRLKNLDNERTKAQDAETKKTDRQAKQAADKAKREKEALDKARIALGLSERLFTLDQRIGAAKLEDNEATVAALEMEKQMEETAAKIAGIKASSANDDLKKVQIAQAELDLNRQLAEASLQRQQGARDKAETVQEFIDGLQLELDKSKAVTEEEKDMIRLKEFEKQLDEQKIILKDKDKQKIMDLLKTQRDFNRAKSEEEFIQQNINNLVNTAGQQFSNLFQTLINGTNSWNDALRNTLNTLANALLNFGISALGGADGVGLFSILAGTFDGGRAKGGSVSSGRSYMVGEQGPELFMPKASGTIVPNSALGGGTANIVVNVDASGSSAEGNAEDSKRLGEAIGVAIRQELIKQKRPGGLLA